MGFEKGKPKTGGRKPGTPNRATNDLRQWVTGMLEGNAEKIAADIAALEPAARVAAWIRLLEFAIPKLNRTQSEHTGPDGGPIQICSIHFVDDTNDAQALPSGTTTQAPQVQPQAPLAQEAPQETVLIVVAHDDVGSSSKESAEESHSDIYY